MDPEDKGWLGANLIHLAQDRDNCLAFMDPIMNFMGSIIRGEFLEWPKNS